MTEFTVDLSEDNETFKEIAEYLSKIQVKRTENPKQFIVSFDANLYRYKLSLKELLGFLCFSHFMHLEEQKQLEEQKRTKKEGFVV